MHSTVQQDTVAVGQLDLDELRAPVTPLGLRRVRYPLARHHRRRTHLHREHRCSWRLRLLVQQSLSVQLPPGEYLVRVQTMSASDGRDRCSTHMGLLDDTALLFNRVLSTRPGAAA